MRIFNLTIGTFLRTFFRTLAYIFIGLLIAYFFGFVNIATANAAYEIPTSDLKSASYAYFTNCVSNDNCWNHVGNTTQQDTGYFKYWLSPDLYTVAWSSGVGLIFYSDTAFVKDNYYTVTILVTADAQPTLFTSNTTKIVGVGTYDDIAYNNTSEVVNKNNRDTSVDLCLTDNDVYHCTQWSGYGGLLSYTFKATANGNYIFLSMTTDSNVVGKWEFLGYSVTAQGTKAPTTAEIEAVLSTHFENINNNINNVANSINSNIDSMKDKQDITNNELSNMNSNIDNMKDKQDTTNNELSNMNSNITNSDSSGATGSAGDFFSGFTTDTFGLTSIITAPLNLIGSITSSTCSDVGIPLPYVKKTLKLPCLTSIYEKYFGDFFSIYQTITFGIVAYWVCVRTFALVKDFKNPDHDEIEVLEL